MRDARYFVKPPSGARPVCPGKELLRLYISRSTLKSRAAAANIQRVCDQHPDGRYHLEVIDSVPLGLDLRAQAA